jgi:hypothetical protein
MRRTLLVIVVLVALGSATAGCDDAADDDGTATTTAAQSSSSSPTSDDSTADTETSPSSSPTAGAAPCTSEAILPVVQEALDSPDIAVASVDVTDCQNGYARAIAVPTGANQQSEQVFLRDDGGAWAVVDYGTGIDCADPASLNEADRAACEALGLAP